MTLNEPAYAALACLFVGYFAGVSLVLRELLKRSWGSAAALAVASFFPVAAFLIPGPLEARVVTGFRFALVVAVSFVVAFGVYRARSATGFARWHYLSPGFFLLVAVCIAIFGYFR